MCPRRTALQLHDPPQNTFAAFATLYSHVLQASIDPRLAATESQRNRFGFGHDAGREPDKFRLANRASRPGESGLRRPEICRRVKTRKCHDDVLTVAAAP